MSQTKIEDQKQAQKSTVRTQEEEALQQKTETLQQDAEAQKQTGKTSGKKKKKRRRIAAFAVSVLLALLFLAYGGTAIYYQSHFLPNTYINQINCSNLDASQTALLLDGQAQSYTLEVTGRGKTKGQQEVLGVIEAQDIGFTSQGTEEALQTLLAQQNSLLWIQAVLGGKAYRHDLAGSYTFEEELLEETLKSWEAFQEKNMTAPQNAYISEYSEKGYEIIPETAGTLLDSAAAVKSISEAVAAGENAVSLEETGCYVEASVKAEDAQLTEACSTMNTWVSTCITYDWNGTQIVVDGEQIHEWISLEGEEPVLDEEAVEEFVADTARELDTYGKNRKFTTALGTELTLPSGGYGWRTDREGESQELIQLIYQGSVLEKEPLYTSRGANKGSDDIGDSYVEIDLSNQHLYLFWEGEIVLESDFVSGDMTKSGRMTPPGVFGLTYKTRNAVLRGEDYETPVNYWMPFNGNIGMHDATWRSSFGGSIYITNGSHGCVNLPLDKAAQIYEYVSTGFPVICYYY